MLDLTECTCVIVGGGEVAARKAEDLLATGTRLIIISPQLHPKLASLAEAGQIVAQHSAYTAGMLTAFKPLLVFAATDDEGVNQQVVDEARAIGALVNAVNANGEHDFINMATVQRDAITIAISSGGTSPELAAHIRAKISDLIGLEYGILSGWLGEARPMIQTTFSSQPKRAAFWQQVITSSILDTLRQGDDITARQQFEQLIHETITTQP